MSIHDIGHGLPVIVARRPGVWTSWRRDQLVHVGFDAAAATRLAADPELDLHRVLDLVAAGCRPGLAVRILAPLTDNERRVV